MSTFIDLDSVWRDKEQYPNENDYQLTSEQVATWFSSSRSVRAYPQNPAIQPLEFSTSVAISHLTIPYSDEVAAFPRIYVNFRSRRYNDVRLINTINGVQPSAKFICIPHKVQDDPVTGAPLWIHYQCNMEQVMRFSRGDEVVFQLTSRSGDILPQQDTSGADAPDPEKQTLCTFQITPYVRDGDFDNHMVETHTT